MNRTAGAVPAGLVGDFPFPKPALAFETESIRAVATHFSLLNAAPAKLTIDPDARFGGLRRARAQVGTTILDYLQIDCSAGLQFVSTRPRASEYFLFVPLRGGVEVVQGRDRITVSPGQIALVGSAGSYTQKRFRGTVELLVIEIPRQALMRTIVDEYGVTPDPMLESSLAS